MTSDHTKFPSPSQHTPICFTNGELRADVVSSAKVMRSFIRPRASALVSDIRGLSLRPLSRFGCQRRDELPPPSISVMVRVGSTRRAYPPDSATFSDMMPLLMPHGRQRSPARCKNTDRYRISPLAASGGQITGRVGCRRF